MNFRFSCPVQVHFCNGISNRLPDYVKSMKRIAVITDANIAKQDWFASIIENIKKNHIECVICDLVVCEPTDDSVNRVAAYIRKQGLTFDGILGIGGGSCMDTAKAVNVLLSNNSCKIEEFLVPNRKEFAVNHPMILIPTTAGTGAEVTRGVVISNKQLGYKRGFGTGGCYATIALIDPTLGKTLNKTFIASTGLDAFCHALESYLVNKTNPLCKQLSLAAIEMIWNNLLLYYEKNDFEARSNMFYASMMATLSFSTGVGLTYSHSISDILGALYPIPHGLASVYTIPSTVSLFEDSSEDISLLKKRLNINKLSEAIITWMNKLNVPHYTTYFPSMSKNQLKSLQEQVYQNCYRRNGLDENQLYWVLQNSFGEEKYVCDY